MNKKRTLITNLTLLAIFVTISCHVLACPPVHKIPDYNCDGEVQIAVIGDSVVFGTGDKRNGGKGGYVLRASKRLSQATVTGFGVPGQQTRQLLKSLDEAFEDGAGGNEMKKALRKADVVIIDEGRNDRWLFGTPLATFRNIKRARKRITKNVTDLEGYPPYIITAALMLPNRGSQGPWVAELNQIIRKRSNRKFPGNLRFDKVSKRLLSEDGIHPSSAGYRQLTKKLVRYLKRRGRRSMVKLRPDTDMDNLQDIFEEERFLTDPLSADTDMDGVSDGEELFSFMTDPLVAEEDSSDGESSDNEQESELE